MAKVNLCILTYQRVEDLLRCIRSLNQISVPEGVDLSISIIENDSAEISRSAVLSAAEAHSLPISYFSEYERGIPVARNKAIEISLAAGADYIAYIDDDEWVEPDWFEQLFNYLQHCGGNVVISGEVKPIFPHGTPEHISGLIKSKNRPTGLKLSACATNNVIFPVFLCTGLGLRFDTSRPLAGGTDTKFFTEAVAKGVDIFKCAEAVVFESIPSSRANLGWMARRKYRAGITDTWRDRFNGASRAKIVAAGLSKILINAVRWCLYTSLAKKLKRNQALLKCCKGAGVLAGVMGVEVESY